MTTTNTNRGEPRDRIMHATFDLVAEEGLGAVTMTAIAERADVARQTLYNHFNDVERIVIAGIEEYTQAGFAHLTDLLDATTTADDKLNLLTRHTVARTRHGHPVSDIRNALSSDARAHLDEHVISIRALIESIIADGVVEGSFDKSIDPGVYAILVEGLLLAAADLAAVSGDPADAAAVTSAAILRVLDVVG